MNKQLARIITMTAVCVSSACWAQDAQPDTKPKATPFKFAAPLGTFSVTPSPLRKDVFDIKASMAPIVPLLESIARQASLKIIASDEVQGLTIPNLHLTQMSADAAIQFIAGRCRLSWGKVGQDTYLIVRASYVPIVPASVVPPPANAQPENKDTPPPDWKPFEFNGTRFYVVPLTESGVKPQK
ncbi:MAG: hypothetical protein M3347_02915 [Armatimonadota bacterium]|nr:hypothetical protein [Armatimonadota bacterium]